MWSNPESQDYPPEIDGKYLDGQIWSDYLAANPDAVILHDETMDLADKAITKSSLASNKYTWLAAN